MTSPHSANIDSSKIEQQYGGILTRACRDLRTFSPMKWQTKTCAGLNGRAVCETAQAVAPIIGRRIVFRMEAAVRPEQPATKPQKTQGESWPVSTIAITSKSNERTREILGKNRNANIFRMMAHSPSYFEQYCRLGGAIRHKGELDPVVRELAITRTGILCEAPYEIVAHKRIGKNVGVTDEQNEALEDWKSATCFNEVQRAALAFTDEIVRLRRPTDAHLQRHRRQADAGGADRIAALRRLLHHDVEVSGNLRHRHAAGERGGVSAIGIFRSRRRAWQLRADLRLIYRDC